MMPPQRTYTTIALALTALLLTGYASAQSFLSWSEKAQEAQRRKDDAAALDAWSNALQLWREKDGKDKKSQALRSRAEILDKQGDWKRAVQDLCAAASIEPKNAAIFHRRGRIYLDHDQVSDAISDFYKATALRSNFAAAFHDRARAYEIIGDAEFSREDYATACRLGLKEACPQAKTSLASRKLQAARTKTPGPRAQTQSGEMEDELVLPPAPEQPPVLAPDEPAPAAKAPVHSEPTAKAPAPAAPLVLTPDEPTPAAKAPA
ncbi:MAG TPA: hypothetical protein DCP85_02105, partial [Elusimicrobia bacterium]|nr:hypothetical protein [Elusimicrobiota bacterium]